MAATALIKVPLQSRRTNPPRWFERPTFPTIMKLLEKDPDDESAKDTPDKGQYHDENRQNCYDEEVAGDIGGDEEGAA